MGRKRACKICSFDKIDFKNEQVTVFRGEDFYENSAEGYLRKYPNWCEFVMYFDGMEEESISISYCPWCGRKL